MSAAVDAQPRLATNSFRIRKNNLMIESDEEAEHSDGTEKTENGTQTKISRSKAPKSPTGSVQKCLSSSIKHIIPTRKPKKRKVKLMDWKKYHRLSVIYGFIDDLERDYPAICTVTVIGKSVEGRDIKVNKLCGLSVITTSVKNVKINKIGWSSGSNSQGEVIIMTYKGGVTNYEIPLGNINYPISGMLKVSNSDASNSAVWLDGSIHSREWISTAVVTYIADLIVKNFQKESVSVTNKDWYIVPVLNPDGYEYTHTKDRMWRKNRACYGGHCVGVDLNRNFSYGWGNNGEEGSSEEPNNVFFRGPAPFSEPESAAVRDTILGSSSTFKVFLSFHSYFELIIFPWGYKKDPCPNYINLLEGGTTMSRAIYESTGMTYKVGSTKDLTYFACGTSTDWSYGIAKIPYSYMIELRSKRHRFRLPRDQIKETCVEIWNGVKSLMDFVDTH